MNADTYGSDLKKCTCDSRTIKRYISKISGPILDRIDLHIEVKPVEYEKLATNDKIETSKEIKTRVDAARKIQIERYKKFGILCNAQLDSKLLSEFCKLDKKSRDIMELAFEKFGLTARAHDKILKIARTIADLDNSQNIQYKHVAEAIQYRSLDKRYFRE